MQRFALFLLFTSALVPWSDSDKYFAEEDGLTYLRGPSLKGHPSMKDVSARKVAPRNPTVESDEQDVSSVSNEDGSKSAPSSSVHHHSDSHPSRSDNKQGVDVSVKSESP